MTKNNDGFTLLEIVISIAALSFISIFILQMFMASSNLNERAKNTDIAVNLAISEIENFKKYSCLSDYLAANDLGNISENSRTITIRLYYDKGWNTMGLSETVPENAGYYLAMDINPDETAPPRKESAKYGKLYTVQVDVADVSSGENSSSLASFRAKKYFPKSFEEGI